MSSMKCGIRRSSAECGMKTARKTGKARPALPLKFIGGSEEPNGEGACAPGGAKEGRLILIHLFPAIPTILAKKNLFFSRAGLKAPKSGCRQPEKQQVPISNPEASVRRAEAG